MRFIYLLIFCAFGLLVATLIFVEIPRIVKSAGYITGDQMVAKIASQVPGVLDILLVYDKNLYLKEIF